MKKLAISDDHLRQGWPGGSAARGPVVLYLSKSFIGNGYFFVHRRYVSNEPEFRNEKRIKRYFPGVIRIEYVKDKDFRKWGKRAKVPVEFTLWMLQSQPYGDMAMFQTPESITPRFYLFVSRQLHSRFGAFHQAYASRVQNRPLVVKDDNGRTIFGIVARTNLYELKPPDLLPEKGMKTVRMKDVTETQKTREETREEKKRSRFKKFKFRSKK